jgi:uncharacterized protein
MNGYPSNPAQLGVRPAPALVQRLLVGAFGWMFAGLLLTAAVAFLVGSSPSLLRSMASLWLFVVIGQFALVMVISAGINRLSATVSLALFFVYAATMGLTMAVIVNVYTGGSVATAFFSAAAMFGGAAAYGAVTKRSLASIGGFLTMAVIGLLVAMFVNLIVGSSTLGFLISIVGVVLFTALTAYDVQRITSGSYAAMVTSAERASVLAALRLYLDFVNLFLFLLRLTGSTRR